MPGTDHVIDHATAALTEAERLMTVCNSCRYCEGLCAVFPAMEMRRDFADGDLNYLANLCHGCGACYHDCQFSPPHDFMVNVPQTLAVVRGDSYAAYAWPPALRPLFARNGVWVALASAVGVAGFLVGFALWNAPGALFAVQRGPGAFYALMPHNAMALLFGGVLAYAVLAMVMGARAFWRDAGPAPPGGWRTLWQAVRDAATLRYLDGGGVGCYNADDTPTDRRRHAHHAVAYGFGLCLAATSVATLYHYAGREAPYPWWDLPVVLGTVGGIGMVAGAVGLLHARATRLPALKSGARRGMDVAFVLMLLGVAVTGLAVLVLRHTGALGVLLAIHLGTVFGLFLSMPYGKFVHGVYRFLALVRYARERAVLERAG